MECFNKNNLVIARHTQKLHLKDLHQNDNKHLKAINSGHWSHNKKNEATCMIYFAYSTIFFRKSWNVN